MVLVLTQAILFAYPTLHVWLTQSTWLELKKKKKSIWGCHFKLLYEKSFYRWESWPSKQTLSHFMVIITYHPLQERIQADELSNVCTGFDTAQNILITWCLLFEMFRFYFNRIKSQCRIKCELLVTLFHGGTGCNDAVRQFKSWVLTTFLMSQVSLKDRQGWGTYS